MAAMAPPADQASDLLKNLSIDSQAKTTEIPEPTKKSSVDAGNGLVQPTNRSVTPLIPDFMDPTMAYYPNGYASAYYYGGYDGTTNDWDDYSRYVNPDGVDLSHGVYGYGYAPYGPYSPAGSPMPTVGQDGQLYGAQHYQYPTSYFPPMTPTTPYSPAPPKGEVTATKEEPALSLDTTKGNTNGVKGNTGSTPVRPTSYQNSSFNPNGTFGRGAQTGYQDPRYSYDGLQSPMPWLDTPIYPDPQTKNNLNAPVASRTQNVRPNSHLMSPRPMSTLNTANAYMNRMYPNKLYGQYGNNTYRSGYGYGYGYGSNAYDLQSNSRGWSTYDNKFKPRGRGNGFFSYNNENVDGLNELNRGPRARSIKNQKGFTPITIAVKGEITTLPSTDAIEKEEGKEVILTPDREQYNQADFPETYENAKFFIIKSYSEDDVHKSIKYNVWASTQNGNKKLDAAYQEAQQISGGCPIFLFFSVNTSGQFVGVAEMIGPVDFEKSLEFWQQDKWIGCFPVKWHIVKDLPNSLLKHIILENNENKPVTNSRDTQEVKLDQGLQMIKIFKEHSSKQCILDDFEFYEDRQKRIQEKKAKQQQYQKQAWEGKPVVDDVVATADVADLGNEVDKDVKVSEVKLADNVEEKVANGC
ncbi:YTH domain-containing protein ECT4 [Lactuca sativa]|uniref:YTH domain-containing family protein n=1 Tax=Lactuca sativa TaxID=4236 RepID=A0A9R1VA12_LACSA|nr:YTH domain-containing protein ECT4 [Lactuca sativa]KAJ0202456.1 hypothetical protein LSAT_V11C600319430 [Lactuca sativa]